jgi:Protein of unknown function (DUF2948)
MRSSKAPRSAGSGSGLRLRAEDAEDLAVISACVQDALVAVRDLAYDREARSFLLIANRFRWEANGVAMVGAPFERTLCAITFAGIDDVAYRGFHRSEEDRILSLLAISFTPVRLPAGAGAAINLEFAAGATIRLSASAIRGRLRDYGEPWPTVWHPGHPLDEPT